MTSSYVCRRRTGRKEAEVRTGSKSGQRYQLDDRVLYQFGPSPWKAVVVEQLGQIGHAGKYWVRIEVPGDGNFNTWETVTPEERLLPDESAAGAAAASG
jgi:hypothetical protein